MEFNRPRLIIAALRGGAGKTVVSLGLTAAWRQHLGLRIIPFKKGPDYIDAGWLGVAAGHCCYNLDPFLMSPQEIVHSFVRHSGGGDVSLIEGNRGLYDGVDANGSYSTAELAKLLRSPVVLVLDATKVTRTAAALVLGCQHLDPGVALAGVIVNRVAGSRHEKVLRESIERCCGIPVLGVVPKEVRNFFPERHLGLVPPQEAGDISRAVSDAASRMKGYLDLDGLRAIAGTAGPLEWPLSAFEPRKDPCGETVRIGIVRDSAFQFYYPENLEALEDRGAVLVEVSSLKACPLARVDALYIGGGFPETHLESLSANAVFRDSVRDAVESGLPVYAECGGLMFLCRFIVHQGRKYPMAGVFPFEIVLGPKPQGHGYTVMECVAENPFFEKGEVIRGHEFHYSRIVGQPDPGLHPFAFKMSKGHGVVAGWDGICYKNVLAGYSHIHAVGNGRWADGVIAAAREYKRNRIGMSADSGAARTGLTESHGHLSV
ncbi:MAG: cobyrinate a,c-diamide synthase [Desulfobacteraceae bacterium]|nr:cobyrinate a,c-diamide synthase [Desulfobacteraceae bacterium]